MPSHLFFIAATTLSSDASSISFTSISQIYTHLVVELSARSTRGDSAQEVVEIGFNGSYASFVNAQRLASGGSTVFTGNGSFSYIGAASTDTGTANVYGSTKFIIPDYTSSRTKGAVAYGVGENNDTTSTSQTANTTWNSTSAITQINLRPQSGTNFKQHTSAYLYGILTS
jgi:hypothetical protein